MWTFKRQTALKDLTENEDLRKRLDTMFKHF